MLLVGESRPQKFKQTVPVPKIRRRTLHRDSRIWQVGAPNECKGLPRPEARECED